MKQALFTFVLSCVLLTIQVVANEEKIVAVYDIEGLISENGLKGSGLPGLSGSAMRPLTHYDIVRSLQAASHDDNVKAVVLDLGGAGLNLAQIQELRRSLLDLRKAGKDVWYYTEVLSNGTALIGSAANHFTLLPEGHVLFSGIYSESMYFKGLLDKLGVEVDVIHIGDFKNAGETLYRTEPSEYAKKQLTKLLDSVYSQIISDISAGRNIKSNKVIQLIDKGIISPEEAKQEGLVDALEYRTDFVNKIRKRYGEKTRFDRSYKLPKVYGPQIKSFMDIMKIIFNSAKKSKYKDAYVGVVALDGAIFDASIAPVREEVLKLAKDKNCKALVLRVNSPGGSALASDVLWEATEEFKATKKPLVVSMGSVAASGGYYVSAAADHIFAEKGTITGSIGVVGMKLVLGDALKKIGISVHSAKRGKNASMMSTQHGFTDSEKGIIRKAMLDTYETFKNRITAGRGKRIKGELESLSGGRVYSGEQALKVGLVDSLGGINEAIAHAAKLAKIKTYKTHLIPEPKSGLEGMLSQPKRRDKDDEFIRAEGLSADSFLVEELKNAPALRLLSSAQRKRLGRFIEQIVASRKCQIMMIGTDVQLGGIGQ